MIGSIQVLQVGQRVHSKLYGGRDGVIFQIHGEPRPQTIRQHVSGVVCMGGSADCDIVWENGTKSLRIPEAIIYGVQWRVHWGDIASQKVIDLLLSNVERVKSIHAYEKQEETRKFDAEKQRLLAAPQYKRLIRMTDAQAEAKSKDKWACSCVVASQNIRKLLKLHFPGVKFSVTTSKYSGGDSIRVKWMDGPTNERVKKVTDPFTGSTFDGMQDLKSYVHTPFNTLFGDSDHVFTDREYSDSAIQSAIDDYFGDSANKPTVEDYRMGRLYADNKDRSIRMLLCDMEL